MTAALSAFWFVILIFAIIIELSTTQFVSIWFGAAALITLIISFFGTPFWLQIIVFVIMTALLLIFTRPIVRKLGGTAERTNADMNIGMNAVITESIDNTRSLGRATVGGVSWKAVSEDGSKIEAGETVVVKDVQGAKLIVSKCGPENR